MSILAGCSGSSETPEVSFPEFNLTDGTSFFNSVTLESETATTETYVTNKRAVETNKRCDAKKVKQELIAKYDQEIYSLFTIDYGNLKAGKSSVGSFTIDKLNNSTVYPEASYFTLESFEIGECRNETIPGLF